MIAIWVAIFFALMSLLAGLLLFPAARDSVGAGVGRLRSHLSALATRWQGRAAQRTGQSGRLLRDAGGRGLRHFVRHRAVLIAALLVLCLPPLLILQFRQKPMLDPSEDNAGDFVSSPQILELLRGERLVPPAELPPAVFVAAEATRLALQTQGANDGSRVAITSDIVGADRKWDRIDPGFQQRVLAVYQIMREQYGYEMALVEGYRSPQRQAQLARNSATTRAGAGQSCHQYGLAVDSAPLRDGRLQWDLRDPWVKRGYFLYGQLAQQAGLEWGGNWRSIKDFVHLELKAECRDARRAARLSG